MKSWERKERLRRMDIIFPLLAEGKTADDIDLILEGRSDRIAKAKKRGIETELDSRSCIEKLPFVRNARIDRTKDNAGIDITVNFYPDCLSEWLREPAQIPNRRFYLQIKSSDTGVREFRKRFGEDEEEVNAKLAGHKIVVINGRAETEVLTSNLRDQLRLMNDYWRNYRNKRK